MTPLSPGTTALLRALEGASPVVAARLLEEIVAAGELEPALALLQRFVVAGADHRERIAASIERLVAGASPFDLLALEGLARTRPVWRPDAWAHAPEVTPERARAFPTRPAALGGVASLHARGHVREAAVEVLARSDDARALPFLLLRAADWVVPVRSAAARGLDAHLARAGGGPFVPVVELVDRLRQVGRVDLSPLADRIERAMARPDAAEALRAGCKDPSPSVRRRSIELAFSARTFDVRPLVVEGLRDPDPRVRIATARGAVRALDGSELEPFVDLLLASTTPLARVLGLEAAWDRAGAGSRAVLERHALDAHARVRQTARFFLGQLPDFDVRAFHRAALGATLDPRSRLGAIEGLGETGAPEDAARLLPWLGHPTPRIRASALRALATLDAAGHRELLVTALSDPSARVTRAARRALGTGPQIDPETLADAALHSPRPHERRAAVSLAGAQDHWVAAVLLLRIAGGSDPDVAARARAALTPWERRANRVFTRPSPAQLDAFAALLDAAGLEAAQDRRLRALVSRLRSER